MRALSVRPRLRNRPRQRADGARKPSPRLAADIVALAREAKQREAALDAATAQLREVHHTIKERMGAAGVRRVVADGVSVLWSPVKGRPAYDMPKVRAACATAGIDLMQFETVGLPTDRLVVKFIEQKCEVQSKGA
jgi:hypothetical protein